jgi:hypothetical protein
MKLTRNFQLMPTLRTCGALSALPYTSPWLRENVKFVPFGITAAGYIAIFRFIVADK